MSNAHTLSAQAAYQLSNTTKTPPQWGGVTPRWLIGFLPWTPVEAGTYRVNRVTDAAQGGITIQCSPSDSDELPQTSIDYEEQPREYTLSTVTTTLEVQTRISDLYRSPMDQVREQLAVLVEMVKERQENELVNNANYGLLPSVAPSMRMSTRAGAPTPDDLDSLIAMVWKEPAFFLAHPAAIAAFGRECTWRGVPPPTVTLFGSPFLTWRGLPLVPCDKLGFGRRQDQRILLLPHRREEAWSRRPFPAGPSWRNQPEPHRSLDGNQCSRRREIPNFSLLLCRRSHR